MGRPLAGVIGMHTPQCADSLLGRPTPQRAVWVQLGQWPRGKATGFTGGISGGGLKSEVQHRWLIFNEW